MVQGAIIQIVAVGAQDAYLTKDPTITYFNLTHHKHTNFAMASVKKSFDAGKCIPGGSSRHKIEREGDMLSKLTLMVNLPALAADKAYVSSVGHAIIDKVELKIGTQVVDTLYGDYLNIYEELTARPGKQLGEMIGKGSLTERQAWATDDQQLYIPLPFWFSAGPQSALPLVALSHHTVELKVYWAQNWVALHDDDAMTLDSSKVSADILCDYVLLNQEERERVSNKEYEAIITQVQASQVDGHIMSSKSNTIDLDFNHPCKELLFACRPADNKPLDYGAEDIIETISFKVNGSERFNQNNRDPVPARLFRTLQPLYHHSNIPSQKVYCYSFSLYPEKSQPSGSLNFSRIDKAKLKVELVDAATGADNVFYLFACSYNILRIGSGIGGLAFSN